MVNRTRSFGRSAACLLLCGLAACVQRSSDSDPIADALQALIVARPQTVLVIGDSLTDFSSGFYLSERLGPQYSVAFRGIINTDFNYWTGRLDDAFAAAAAGPPEHVLVALGTNDGFTLTPDQFVRNVHIFHTELRRRSLARVYYFFMPGTLIATLAPAIRANNAALRADHPADGTVLVDLEAVFDQAAPLPALYLADDPLHPTDNGYRIMAAEMERAIRQ
jgi:lysophospholipase L1-like esterase